MATNRASIPAGNVAFVDGNGVLTSYGRNLLVQLIRDTFTGPAATGWIAPTGTGSRASINAAFTTPVGAGYSQAQVQAIETQVEALSKAVAQLIVDLSTVGAIA
jgi:hypothetical protein